MSEQLPYVATAKKPNEDEKRTQTIAQTHKEKTKHPKQSQLQSQSEQQICDQTDNKPSKTSKSSRQSNIQKYIQNLRLKFKIKSLKNKQSDENNNNDNDDIDENDVIAQEEYESNNNNSDNNDKIEDYDENDENDENEGDELDEEENENDSDFIDDIFGEFASPFIGWDADIDKKNPETVKKYTDLITKLETKLPKFQKVFESNLSDRDKENCLWQVAILNSPEARFDEHYVSHALKLDENIEYFKTLNEAELKTYHECEQKFGDLITDKPIKNKIFDLPVDDKTKKIIYKHYTQNNIEKNEKEAKWLDVVLSIPWGKYVKINVPDPATIMTEWNKELAGMIPAKEEFLLTLTDYITNPTINPKILTLKGVPGCGKTLFVQSISKILKLPVEWIDLAGMNDANFLKGFSKTWEASKEGRLVESIINMESMIGIIVLEEIDKIESKTGHGKEAMNSLVPILDRTRNHTFFDNYLSDVSVPLNNIIFVATCNDDKDFPKYLLDRLNIIDVPKPDMEKKIDIAKNYILPSALKDRNITKDDIIIDDSVIKYIIDHYTNEEGVRTLKERLQSIVQRINYFIKNGIEKSSHSDGQTIQNSSISFPSNFTLPFKVTQEHVDVFLKFQKQQKESLTYFM